MLFRRPDDILSVRRNLQILAAFLVATHIAEQPRLTAAHVYRPRLLLRHFCLACRICRRAFLVRLAAARVNDRLPVRRQPHARYRLAIIAFVMRYLSRRRNPAHLATQMLRSPLLSNTHATRGACDALVRPYGNGALSTCSMLKLSPKQATGSNMLPRLTTRK